MWLRQADLLIRAAAPPTEPVGEGGSMPTTYGEPGRGGHYGAPRPYCHIGLLLYTNWVFTHHCRSNPVNNSNILMLHAVVLCGNFPSGASIAFPQGGWHRFVVPVAALSTPCYAPPQRRLPISPHHTGLRTPSPNPRHDLDSTTVYPVPRQGRGGAHRVFAAST